MSHRDRQPHREIACNQRKAQPNDQPYAFADARRDRQRIAVALTA
jgi:hypothetical protein